MGKITYKCREMLDLNKFVLALRLGRGSCKTMMTAKILERYIKLENERGWLNDKRNHCG
jgi:hypothetical protein